MRKVAVMIGKRVSAVGAENGAAIGVTVPGAVFSPSGFLQ